MLNQALLDIDFYIKAAFLKLILYFLQENADFIMPCADCVKTRALIQR
jgi:hypothetical protein